MDVKVLTKLVAEWEASDRFPCPKNGTPLLLLTEHNLSVIGAALHAANVKSVNDIVIEVNKLTEAGKLQFDIPRVVEKEVIREVVKEVQAVKSEKQKAREARETLERMGIQDKKFRPVTDYDNARSKHQVLTEEPIEKKAFDSAQQLSAEAALDRMITNISAVNASGRVDHAKTHRQREQLRAIQYTTATGAKDFVRMAQEAANLIRAFEKEKERHNSW
jgi:hypothetical protein